jgi:hypothetical protein
MPAGTWPDVDEAEAYIGEVGTDQLDVLENTLNAVIAYIGWRCNDELDLIQDTGSAYYYDEIVPDNLREAVLLQTARQFRRRLSPEGVAGFGEFGAVRVTRVDPDIEALITPNRSWGIA